jgi:hypothetical protein
LAGGRKPDGLALASFHGMREQSASRRAAPMPSQHIVPVSSPHRRCGTGVGKGGVARCCLAALECSGWMIGDSRPSSPSASSERSFCSSSSLPSIFPRTSNASVANPAASSLGRHPPRGRVPQMPLSREHAAFHSSHSRVGISRSQVLCAQAAPHWLLAGLFGERSPQAGGTSSEGSARRTPSWGAPTAAARRRGMDVWRAHGLSKPPPSIRYAEASSRRLLGAAWQLTAVDSSGVGAGNACWSDGWQAPEWDEPGPPSSKAACAAGRPRA